MDAGSTTEKDRDSVVEPEARPWAVRFFTIWIGQALSLVRSQMGGFALVWWLTQASGGSATVLATSSLVATLPMVFLGPFAGAMVDRWSRRRVMIVADLIVALFSAALAILAWTGLLQIWHIYCIVFIRALGGTFHFVAMQAATSLMVPSDQLPRISGMNQALRGALGIITLPSGHWQWVYCLCTRSWGLMSRPLHCHRPAPPRTRPGSRTPAWFFWQDERRCWRHS